MGYELRKEGKPPKYRLHVGALQEVEMGEDENSAIAAARIWMRQNASGHELRLNGVVIYPEPKACNNPPPPPYELREVGEKDRQ